MSTIDTQIEIGNGCSCQINDPLFHFFCKGKQKILKSEENKHKKRLALGYKKCMCE